MTKPSSKNSLKPVEIADDWTVQCVLRATDPRHVDVARRLRGLTKTAGIKAELQTVLVTILDGYFRATDAGLIKPPEEDIDGRILQMQLLRLSQIQKQGA